MPDRSDVGWFLGGLATGVVVGKVLDEFHRAADDDRPVIEVGSGSMKIHHKRRWKNHQDDRHWHPDHPNGRPVSFFVIQVNEPEGYAPGSGEKITFYFKDQAGTQVLVTVRRQEVNGKMVPWVESGADLGVDFLSLGQTLVLDTVGRIARIDVDDQQFAVFPPGDDPEKPEVKTRIFSF